jgi:hypothetical protein
MIDLYTNRIKELKDKIKNEIDPANNATRPKSNPLLKQEDFNYLVNQLGEEVNNAPR